MPPVHHGHLQIEYDEVRCVVDELLEAFLAVFGDDDGVPVQIEELDQQRACRNVVVHDEHQPFRHRGVDTTRHPHVDRLCPALREKHTGQLRAQFDNGPDVIVAQRHAFDRPVRMPAYPEPHAVFCLNHPDGTCPRLGYEVPADGSAVTS